MVNPSQTYVFNEGFMPIIWPIVGTTGKEMTGPGRWRELPPGETRAKRPLTYIKNRWFDHGNVNGSGLRGPRRLGARQES